MTKYIMQENNEEKPKRRLAPDKVASTTESLRPPSVSAVAVQKKLGAGALAGRAAIGAVLLSAVGVGVYFTLPKGQAPPMEVPKATAVQKTAAVNTKPVAEKPLPTAEKMVEIKPVSAPSDSKPAAPKPTATVKPALPKEGVASALPKVLPIPRTGSPDPLVSPKYDAKDGLPVYVCGMKSNPSHFTLINMQVDGIDVKHGFHLALVPLALNEKYDIPDDVHMPLLRDNKWDCFAELMEETSIWDIGVITAVMDENTGTSGIWGRNITDVYDLKNRTVSFVKDSSSEYFLNYAIALLPEDARASVKTVGFSKHDEAVKAYLDGDAQAISGWQSQLDAVIADEAKPVILTSQLRASANAILTSRDTIKRDPKLVSAFHKAFFEALHNQIERPGRAANSVASWGHNEYTGVSLKNAQDDYEKLMKTSATTSLVQNIALMKNPAPLIRSIEFARALVVSQGQKPVEIKPQEQLETRFIIELEKETALRTKTLPIDPTFSLVRDDDSGSTPGGAASELPCRNFTFKPSSSDLTDDSKRIIDVCVLPALQIRAASELKIIGSAAWPKGEGFDEARIKTFGLQRAQAVADYLASQGVEAKRIKVDSVVPPDDRRNTSDESKLSRDRYVEMTIASAGW